MRAQTLPATAGGQWLLSGYAIFKRNPPVLSMLVISYWFTVIFLNILPIVGALAASLLIPGLSVGLMQAARNVERGQPIGLQTLYGGLKENTKTLLALGGLYLFCTLAILGLSALVDGGDLFRYMLADTKAERAALEDTDFVLPALFVIALLVPLIMAYWFAPVLAAWHRLTLGRALFFSFIACWVNWRPFLVFGIGLLFLAGIIPGLVLGLLLVLFPAAQGFISVIVMALMGLIVAPIVFASFYASYRDIFGISEIV
ncbi:MAG: hypothetical protein CVU16_10480 [Betaproteobacteria bacterium HGW-Betaproteobacteria-10]|nr:MAG: hypothetical protein CVU16_10480 [Betaproteobacteria bacterium HGW-Betaproteobacteria-10]